MSRHKNKEVSYEYFVCVYVCKSIELPAFRLWAAGTGLIFLAESGHAELVGVTDPTIERDEAIVGRGETCGPTVGFRKEVNHSQLCHVLGATTQVSPLERGQPIAMSQH
jgi:hypothetical protein